MRCDIPGIIGRAARSPILPCTELGLSCLLCYLRSGELLPPHFTLTHAEPRLRIRRYIFCDTIRHAGLPRSAPAFTGNPALRCPDFPLNLTIKRTPALRNRPPHAGGRIHPAQAGNRYLNTVPAAGLGDAILKFPCVFANKEGHVPLGIQSEARVQRFL